MRPSFLRLLMDPEGGEGGDNSADKGKDRGQGPDLAKQVENLIARHGDSTAALRVLMAENFGYRDKIRDIEKQVPPAGAVVLTGDDAKNWGAYTSLGKPSDLSKAKEERDAHAGRLKQLERESELRSVAEKARVDGQPVKFSVLKTLAADGLVFGEGKAKGKDGKEETVVTVKDGDAEPVPFDEYAAARWADFLPALKAEAATPPARPPGTPNRDRAAVQPAARPADDAPKPQRLVGSI